MKNSYCPGARNKKRGEISQKGKLDLLGGIQIIKGKEPKNMQIAIWLAFIHPF